MNKPIHDSDDMCPLMSKKRKLVCHKCAFYRLIRGRDPQTDVEIDHWDCAIALLPMLMIETGRQINVSNAALVSLRNEFVDGNNKRMTTDIMRTQALIKASQRHDN